MNLEDLGLLPATLLIEELVRRNETVVIILRRPDTHNAERSIVTRRFQGDHHVAMGLAIDMAHQIQMALEEVRESCDGDDG